MENKRSWIHSLFGRKPAKQASASPTPPEVASPKPGSDLHLELTITPEEATGGCQKEIVVLRYERCRACDGKSQIPTTSCEQCHGNGRVQENRRIALTIPAGVKDGAKIRLTGAGNAGPSGSTPGNLYVVLSVTSAKPTSTPPRRAEESVPAVWKVGDCILGLTNVAALNHYKHLSEEKSEHEPQKEPGEEHPPRPKPARQTMRRRQRRASSEAGRNRRQREGDRPDSSLGKEPISDAGDDP